MITELTPNLIALLNSDDVKDNALALMLMGYNECRSDYVKLNQLLDPYDLDVFYFGAKNGSNYFPIEKMIIVQRNKTITNHGKHHFKST